MSEPTTIAKQVEEVATGVWNWTILDERINFRGDAHAVAADDGVVLIDPLPLEAGAFQALGPVKAICLTAACHQRAAWRYRRECEVMVYAPLGSRETDEEPDVRYKAGDALPGGLQAVHTPGPEPEHYSFLRSEAPGVLFCSDLVMRTPDGALHFVPGEYHNDPGATQDSVRRLLDLEFAVLCLDHGPPLTENPHEALRELLALAMDEL